MFGMILFLFFLINNENKKSDIYFSKKLCCFKGHLQWNCRINFWNLRYTLNFDLLPQLAFWLVSYYNIHFWLEFLRIITRIRNNSSSLTILIHLLFLKSAQITWLEGLSSRKSLWLFHSYFISFTFYASVLYLCLFILLFSISTLHVSMDYV